VNHEQPYIFNIGIGMKNLLQTLEIDSVINNSIQMITSVFYLSEQTMKMQKFCKHLMEKILHQIMQKTDLHTDDIPIYLSGSITLIHLIHRYLQTIFDRNFKILHDKITVINHKQLNYLFGNSISVLKHYTKL
jgi:hypothetical protein